MTKTTIPVEETTVPVEETTTPVEEITDPIIAKMTSDEIAIQFVNDLKLKIANEMTDSLLNAFPSLTKKDKFNRKTIKFRATVSRGVAGAPYLNGEFELHQPNAYSDSELKAIIKDHIILNNSDVKVVNDIYILVE
jgi:hypothetical protein